MNLEQVELTSESTLDQMDGTVAQIVTASSLGVCVNGVVHYILNCVCFGVWFENPESVN